MSTPPETAVVLEAGLSLRAATAADDPFLRRLYASTRAHELAGLGWGEHEQRLFLDQQFTARAADHRHRFSDADDLVVEHGGVPIGRLIVAATDQGDALLVDIALLPQHRGIGLGSRLLRWVVSSADGAVVLHVLASSPARRLYERFGFSVVGGDGVYATMRRAAAPLN